MPKPVELSLFPSCFGAADWSPDGELAVAGSDQVHILTWKAKAQNNTAQNASEGWHITRILRVNFFTFTEWPTVHPQNRDDFSVGVEQSPSNVIGLAWSPPGLARYRRSVLAILTSNLILSLWEPVGANGEWVRVCIINHALYPNPEALQKLHGAGLQKTNIRSFQWCPPAQVSQNPGSRSRTPEDRWGVQLMAATTDSNEVVFLRIYRPTGLHNSSKAYIVNKLATHSIYGAEKQFPMACSGSLLQSALKSKLRLTSISCGPWLTLKEPSNGSLFSATSVIAVLYGTELRFIQATVALVDTDPDHEVTPQYEAIIDLKHHPLTLLSEKWAHNRIVGPLKWVHASKYEKITLSIGIVGGLLTITCPSSALNCSEPAGAGIEIQEWPCSSLPTEEGELFPRHMEPVSTQNVQDDLCTLHMGTVGGLGAAIDLDKSGNFKTWRVPQWMDFVQRYREEYDLDRDLRGYNLARIWGLATYQGFTAIVFTMHPTDMVEYRMNSAEGAFVGFIDEATGEVADMHAFFMPPVGDDGQNSTRVKRGQVITSVLSTIDQEGGLSQENYKMIYTAACCAVTDEQTEQVRHQAREWLERLAEKTGADLSEEISKCANGSPMISAKSNDHLNGPGSYLFERCEVCDAGLIWDSPREVQCQNGHLFVRCGLSFQAIQEPGVSKYCSICQAEYFDEDILTRVRDGHVDPVFMHLFDTFDTCIYCDKKFQAIIQDR
ncbi:uncharacterized protein N7483_005151 [Penicillium malachiteum]|uniref:uncharacterized protein n=1 Tax=Penicillium malachiteum TaxID=1324776 RepID=UPI0025480505|nr:uncharacterized protein N7483_005151 [Penicillium malachiteum]KAJ5730643.1 hypothetical protein N7483_005151 [Penicillium malachiteum]